MSPEDLKSGNHYLVNACYSSLKLMHFFREESRGPVLWRAAGF